MTAEGFVFRAATHRDLGDIEALEAACFASDPWPRESFESFIGRDNATFVVAEDSARAGHVAGYALLFQVLDQAELLNLALARDCRCRGVGSALLRALLTAGEARGIRTVYLEVRESNAAARALYETHGFLEVGRRRRYYQRPVEDALILQRVWAKP
ncbi:MAG: ribosomal protein S18-alanine N-acetyltransferase [Gemmatimonadaceae bacterium]